MQRPRSRRKRRSLANRPQIRFTPTAWAKLLYLRDRGPTEVGGFGISAEGDPLLIEEFSLVRQVCTEVSVKFDDQAVADYFDQQVDRGLTPDRFARVWIHTHPGTSATPSSVDEATFVESFRGPDWAVMLILARGGATYARLRFNSGPGAEVKCSVGVEFQSPFAAADQATWEAEYDRCVVHESTPCDPEEWQALLSLGEALLAEERPPFDIRSPNRKEVSVADRH